MYLTRWDELTLVVMYIQCILTKEQCVESMNNKKMMIISVLVGVLIYILISMYLPLDYTTKLSLGLLLLILYLGLIFLKKGK